MFPRYMADWCNESAKTVLSIATAQTTFETKKISSAKLLGWIRVAFDKKALTLDENTFDENSCLDV